MLVFFKSLWLLLISEPINPVHLHQIHNMNDELIANFHHMNLFKLKKNTVLKYQSEDMGTDKYHHQKRYCFNNTLCLLRFPHPPSDDSPILLPITKYVCLYICLHGVLNYKNKKFKNEVRLLKF